MPEAAEKGTFPVAQFRNFALAAMVVTLAFASPLWQLFWFAIADDLHSYIPLMPVVCVYLAWTQKPALQNLARLNHFAPARLLAAAFLAAGVSAAAAYWMLTHAATPAGAENSLALATLAWLLCLTGAGCWFLGGAVMRLLVFPCFLLYFMIPLPVALKDGIETALQHGSALVAEWMYVSFGTPVLRDGMEFHLPGFSLEVAPECSGIHSTWILFITSLVAGWLILRRPWKRLVLCLAVIPLALLRNGFRIFVIGELCVHVSPRMIDSPIHRHGGPLFFLLSLAPFFLLLYLLSKNRRTVSADERSKSEQ